MNGAVWIWVMFKEINQNVIGAISRKSEWDIRWSEIIEK